MKCKQFDIENKLLHVAYWQPTKTESVRKEIIDHVHALEEELERLRWHYPERGELPKEDDEIFAEASDADEYWTGDYNGNDKLFVESCKRWRYIE